MASKLSSAAKFQCWRGESIAFVAADQDSYLQSGWAGLGRYGLTRGAGTPHEVAIAERAMPITRFGACPTGTEARVPENSKPR